MRGSFALLGALALAAPAVAQDKTDFDSAEGLYALKELHEGGRPLYRKLFRNGWPTDKKHVDMTLGFAAKKAELLTRCYLAAAGGAGQTVPYSDYQFGRLDWRAKKGQRFTNTASLLNEELRVFRHLSATRLRTTTHGLRPPFIPFVRCKAQLASSWDPDNFQSWRWRDQSGKHSLEALGLAMVLEATYAREQLAHTRKEEQKGKQVDLYGQTPLDGFFALTGLHAAAAQVWALRNTLMLDFRSGKMRRTAELSVLNKRRFFYPAAWSTDVGEGRAAHTPLKTGDGDSKAFSSSLRGQAAVLWGISELAGLMRANEPKALKELFKQRTVRGQQWWLYDYRLQRHLIEVALFTSESIRTLHMRLAGKGRVASEASPKGRGRFVTPEDQGMLLVALSAFVDNVETPERGRNEELKKALTEEQRKAKRIVADLARTIRTWQANQVGFFDRYNADSDNRSSKTRSLISQAWSVRGLIAAHRALSPNRDTYLRAANRALNWLDERRWDPSHNAYVERGKKDVSLKAAMAVLGALREMALVTGDGRYLLRYKQYLESLRGAGLYREPGGSTAPGLHRVITFTKSK